LQNTLAHNRPFIFKKIEFFFFKLENVQQLSKAKQEKQAQNEQSKR
jgi:hypothetical protein